MTASRAVPTDDATPALALDLAERSKLDANYLALILASCAIATFGLLENSSAVIIGAMIIAPLMPVIQGVAYGVLEGHLPTIRHGLVSLAAGVLTAVALSAALARMSGLTDYGGEIIGRGRPNLLDLGIALAAGAIGAFARTRPSIASSLAGTAIAVALMPPLCVVGIGIAGADWQTARGAAILFTTNLLGITLMSMVVFLLAGVAHRHAVAALAWTSALTAIIVIPLALSFQTLVHEAAIETALRDALTKQTVTFRGATLVSSRFDWLSQPPLATFVIRSPVVPSPHQVALLEAFAQRVTKQRFQLVVDTSQTWRVTSATAEPTATPSMPVTP